MKEPVAALAPANRAWIRPSWLGVRTKPTWGVGEFELGMEKTPLVEEGRGSRHLPEW